MQHLEARRVSKGGFGIGPCSRVGLRMQHLEARRVRKAGFTTYSLSLSIDVSDPENDSWTIVDVGIDSFH